jgi:hypothetical protein
MSKRSTRCGQRHTIHLLCFLCALKGEFDFGTWFCTHLLHFLPEQSCKDLMAVA